MSTSSSSTTTTTTATTTTTTSSTSSSSSSSSSLQTADIPPNHTLYINNLFEKLKKEDLKKSLYHLYSTYGNVLDIVANKTYKLGGQAWIIYDDLSGSTKALKEMQGFMFYGKPMRVSFAKAKSDVISKNDGTFQPRPKRKPDAPPKAKGTQLQNKKKKTQPNGESKEEEKEKKEESSEVSHKESSSTPSLSSAAASMASQQSQGSRPPAMYQNEIPAPPNRILFVENLPAECNTLMLSMLFQQYNGFQEVRLVNGKPGIAFVEYSDEYNAGIAKNTLQNFKITPTNLMKISFEKKWSTTQKKK